MKKSCGSIGGMLPQLGFIYRLRGGVRGNGNQRLGLMSTF